MANPTTNYGWPMPTSTDLVTDLPADFAAFGQPVDTSLKALNPETTLGDIAYRSATSNTNTRLGIGTNGQVLAVSGGVPAWTTTADVTPLTTKGDLFTFTTVDARIGIGANNTVLTADSAEATGMKWATPAGGGKVLQVVQATYSTSTANATTTFADTGLSLSITPTSATSKVLVFVNQYSLILRDATEQGHALKIFRGATEIFATGTGGGGSYIYVAGSTSSEIGARVPLTYLDSPATTSATTYKTQGRPLYSTSSGQVVFQHSSQPSVITLMEIGA